MCEVPLACGTPVLGSLVPMQHKNKSLNNACSRESWSQGMGPEMELVQTRESQNRWESGLAWCLEQEIACHVSQTPRSPALKKLTADLCEK